MKRVLMHIINDNVDYVIVDSDLISYTDWGFLYNEYGQQIGEEQKIYSPAVNYHDGYHLRSAVISDGTHLNPRFCYIDSELENEILEDFGNVEFSKFENGFSNVETKKYKFSKSLFANSFGIDVTKLN